MQYEKLDVSVEGTVGKAMLTVYALDASPEIQIKKRPMILICPGGGYIMTSDREAEIVAMQFVAMGYHAAVLRYSVAPAVFPTAVCELGKSVALIRENAEKWNVDEDKIAITGFSAGGHLVASFCMFWTEKWLADKLGVASRNLKPNAMILGYPVITSGEYAHRDSFENLLGSAYEEKKEAVSLEKCVNDQVPRTFIWHTFEDDCVPVENSLLLVGELVKHKIPTEFHLFEKGGHGLSLANRITKSPTGSEIEEAAAGWIEMVHKWLERWA